MKSIEQWTLSLSNTQKALRTLRTLENDDSKSRSILDSTCIYFYLPESLGQYYYLDQNTLLDQCPLLNSAPLFTKIVQQCALSINAPLKLSTYEAFIEKLRTINGNLSFSAPSWIIRPLSTNCEKIARLRTNRGNTVCIQCMCRQYTLISNSYC